MGEIKKAFATGGIWMYLILGVSILALGVIIERFVFIFFKYNINANAFMGQIQKLVMANNIDRAIKLCNAAPNAALPKAIKAGLTRANKGELEISNAIEEATLEIVPIVQKRTPTLGGVANVATLLGLLGTIWGLIEAFKAVATAPPEMKQTLLAGGISIAMYTTAGGLRVAIPTLILHSIVMARTNKIMDDVDQYGLKTVNLLTARRRGTLKEDAVAEQS